MSNSKQFLKHFVILFSGNTLAQLIPFVLAPWVARLFRPEEIAVQENFLALASLISIAAAGRYEFAFLLPGSEPKARALLRLSLWISVAFAALSLLAVAFSDAIAKAYRIPEMGALMPYLAPSVLLLALLSVWSQWIIRRGWFSMVTGIRILQSLVQNLGYVLLGYWAWGVHGLIVAWLLGVLLPVLWMMWKERSTLVAPVPEGAMGEVARTYREFPTVNALHAFTDILATQFLINWAITRNYGALAFGLFALMNRYVRAPLNLIGSALGQLYYREVGVARDNVEAAQHAFRRSVLYMGALATPVLVVLLWAGPELFAWYLGENWREAGAMARWMIPAYLFNMLASVVSSTAILRKKQKTTYVFSLVGYALSLSVFVIGPLVQAPFEQVLLAYSIVLSVYYLALLVWYRRILAYPAHASAD
jgi:O-antigen/teichoic acid export membrane protein